MSALDNITPCIETGCEGTVHKNARCKKHYEPFKGSTRKERLPAGWDQLRKAILIRDQHRCHICGGFGADAVDHLKAGDDHRPKNLAAVHHNVQPYCHRGKTAREGQEALNGNPF